MVRTALRMRLAAWRRLAPIHFIFLHHSVAFCVVSYEGTLMPTTDTEHLLDRAAEGDATARDQLLERFRRRLRRMVAVRFDPRLAARVDPSDVVQESLAEASAQLNRYLRDRPLPFYPWLRQFA